MDRKLLVTLQVLTGIGVIFLLINHGRAMVSLLTPVMIGILLTLLLLPLVDYLHKLIKSRLAASLIVLIPTYALLGLGIWWAFNRLYREAEGFVSSVPTLMNTLKEFFNERIWPLVEGTAYEESIFLIRDDVILRGVETLQEVVKTVITSGISLIGVLPGLFVAFMVTIILSFYLIYDKKWVFNLIPGADKSIDQVLKSIHGFIKAQFFLISITAAICMLAFSLLGIPYVLVFGGLIAIFDLLPILGAGTLLVPMIIWYFAAGQPFTAIMVILLYAVILVVRQIVEPRLLAHNLGIHPIVAILAVFLGLKLFGPIGLILLPLIASIAAGFPRFRWLKR